MRKLLKNKTIIIIVSIIIILLGGFFLSKFLLDSGLKISYYPYNYLERTSGIKDSLNLNEKSYILSTNQIGVSNENQIKLIKRGSVEIEIEKDEFFTSLNRIILLTNQYNGNLISSQIFREENKNSGFIVVMVPSKDFDNFITKLNDYGDVKSVVTTTEDVSKEYYDSLGRLKILESQRELLLSWLKDAKEIKDMLTIRSELEKIETEIETIKGRVNYLDYHSNYSEISINLIEKREKLPWWKKIDSINRIINGLLFALNTIVLSIITIIIVLAFVLPWALIGYLLYRVFRKYFKKKEEKI